MSRPVSPKAVPPPPPSGRVVSPRERSPTSRLSTIDTGLGPGGKPRMPARQRSPTARASISEPASAPSSSSVASDAASALDELLGESSPPKPVVRAVSATAAPRTPLVRQRSPVARPASNTLPRVSTLPSAAAKAAAEKAAQEKAAAEQAAAEEAQRKQQQQAQQTIQVQPPESSSATTIDSRGRTVSKPPAGTPRSRSLSPSSRSNANFTTGDLDVAHRDSFVGNTSYPKSHDDSEAAHTVRRMATAPFASSPNGPPPPSPSANNTASSSSSSPPEASLSLSTLSTPASPPGACLSPLDSRRPSLQRVRSPSPAPGSSAGVIMSLREQVVQLNAELARLGQTDSGKRILELEEQIKKLGEENGQIRQENTVLANENSKYFFESQALHSDLTALRADNAALKSLLQTHNIPLPPLSQISASPRTPRTPRSPFSAAFATTTPTDGDFELAPFVAVSDMGASAARRPS